MSFVEVLDVGTTPRRKLMPHQRLQVWERAAGLCVICHRRIDGVRERWIVGHIRALELGGADELNNMGPAHQTCASTKTKDDQARAAKAKRQKITTYWSPSGQASSPLRQEQCLEEDLIGPDRPAFINEEASGLLCNAQKVLAVATFRKLVSEADQLLAINPA